MRKDMRHLLDRRAGAAPRFPCALVDQFYSRLEARGGKRWTAPPG